jgi:carbonic anhydrase/acetyltransferase-like protein (isoleucine patch superfamily)
VQASGVQEGGPSMRRAGAAYVHRTAVLHGAVTLGENASVWCHAVLRAEMHEIVIGEGSNVQDHVMIHVGYRTPTIVGRYCSITHHATLHGCRIHDNVLVGISATVMDGAEIGANSIVAPHACVTEGTIIPPNSIVMGVPGKVTRTRDSFVANRLNAFLYWRNAQSYAAGDERLWSRETFQAELRAEEARLKALSEAGEEP